MLIAVAVVVALRERQSAPPPEVPVAQTSAKVRVKAVERKMEPVAEGEVAAASGAVAIVCGEDAATAERYEARNAAGQLEGSTRDGSGTITICTNNAISASYVYGTIVHELIHAYDSCKGKDFSDCEQRACSEIRAYKNSGQCQLGGAHPRKVYTYTGIIGIPTWYYESEEECIKRSAKASTSVDWKCRSNIDKYVNDAYKNCAGNKDPF